MSTEFAVLSVESFGTRTLVSHLKCCAVAAIHARRVGAEVDLNFTPSSHVARLAVAKEIVDHLRAVESSGVGAWVREAFVYVTFATISNKSRWASALETANLVNA